MSLLEKLVPVKEPAVFELSAYKEDMEVFLGALEYLELNNKGSGKFTQESLFEHLTTQLRSEDKIMEHVFGRQKRKKRGARSKVRDEAQSIDH